MDTKMPEQLAIPQVYANLSQVSANVSDISIALGLAGTAPIGTAEHAPSTTVAVVRLSPPAAKMLLLNLEQMLKLYEARFSAIHIPKEFEDAMRDGDEKLGLTPKDGAS